MSVATETVAAAARPAMTTFEKARALADAGYAVFPCYADKRPACAGGFKAATREPTPEMFAGAALVGIPTGPVNGFDVLDLDVQHGAEVWLAQNAKSLPKTHTQVTRSGGLHLRFNAARGLRNSAGKLAPGVDIRAEGGYIVAWGCEGFETRNPDVVADWPKWLVQQLQTRREKAAARTAADLAPPSIAAAVELLNAMPNPDALGRDQWVAIGLAAAGCQQGAEAVGMDDEGAIREAWLAWSAKWVCADLDADETRWDDDFSTRKDVLAGWRQLLGHATALGVDIQPFTAVEAEADFANICCPPEPPNAWKTMLVTTEKGKPLPDLQNCLVAFSKAPEWRGVLRFDEFAQRTMLMQPPPWGRNDFTPRALGDVDITKGTVWLQRQGIHIRGSGTAGEAMVAVAHESPFHPVRDYLKRLAWDRNPRIDTWLTDYLGVEDTPLHRAFAAKFLISAVARVMQPGCQVDTVLTLEGPQGIGKSNAARTLAGAWGATAGSELGSKDALHQLQGRWIIEHAEMSHMRRADAARIKAWFSETVDVFRPSYGRFAAEFPRQCVFIATINPESTGYLRDETGARRFWPVLCGATWGAGRKADIAALAAVRDQLWAEARDRYAAREPWWIDRADLQAAQAEAAADRSEQDAWHDAVLRAAECAPPAPVTIAGIMAHPALDLPTREQDTTSARRIGAILRSAGYSSRKTRRQGWVWDAPAHLQPAPAAEGGNVVALTSLAQKILDGSGATAGAAG